MWWYNILGDNERSISHILWLDPITSGYILLTDNLVSMIQDTTEPILKVKRTEWGEFIDYSGLSIEDYPSRVGKKKKYFSHVGYIARPSSVKLHMSRRQLENVLICNHKIYVCTNY